MLVLTYSPQRGAHFSKRATLPAPPSPKRKETELWLKSHMKY